MHFTVNKEQKDFFQKNGWIEFEDLLKPTQIKTIEHALEETLAERLKIPLPQVEKEPAEQIYHQGRDLWRSHPILKQFVMQPRFGEVAIELMGKKGLRLGYDQLLPAPLISHPSSLYTSFLEKGLCLEEMSSIKGIVCGVIIALDEKKERHFSKEEPGDSTTINIFPYQSGNVLFFLPHLSIDWSRLLDHSGRHFYLIVYTSLLSFYQLQPNDPHAHALKHLGYIFNDPLSDKLNPIVYRS